MLLLRRASRFVPRRSAVWLVCALGLTSPTLFGCGTTSQTVDWGDAEQPEAVLQSGDQLRIAFAYWPELDETQCIGPDGKIALPLVGEVEAAGSTPAELRADLLARYESKIIDPEINVIVESLVSREGPVRMVWYLPGTDPMQGRAAPTTADAPADSPTETRE